MRRRRLHRGAPALLAALALAGCGASGAPAPEPADAAAYVRRVDGVQRDLAAAFARVQDGLGTTATPREQARALGAFAAAAGSAARSLDAVAPPASVATQHRALAQAVTRFSAAITAARAGLVATPDVQSAFRASAALEEASATAQGRIDAARSAIDAGLER